MAENERIVRALAQIKDTDRVPGATTEHGISHEEIARTWFPVRLKDGRISYVPSLPPGPRSDAAQRVTEAIMQGAALSELAKQRGQREPLPDNLDALTSYVIERGKRYQGRQQEQQKNQHQQDYYRHGIRNPNFGVY